MHPSNVPFSKPCEMIAIVSGPSFAAAALACGERQDVSFGACQCEKFMQLHTLVIAACKVSSIPVCAASVIIGCWTVLLDRTAGNRPGAKERGANRFDTNIIFLKNRRCSAM